MAHHPLDGILVEQIGVIFQQPPKFAFELPHRQGEVELGGDAFRLERADDQPWQLQILHRRILKRKHDLE